MSLAGDQTRKLLRAMPGTEESERRSFVDEVATSEGGWCGGDDDDGCAFAVDGGDERKNDGGFCLDDENKKVCGLCGLPRRSLTVQRAHQDAEIEAGDMDQIALVQVFASAQPSPSHPAAIEDMGEGTLDQFAAPSHRLSPDPGFQPRPVGVDGSPGRVVAMPAQIALGRLGFGDARLPHAVVERLQLLARMIALVGDHDAGLRVDGGLPRAPGLERSGGDPDRHENATVWFPSKERSIATGWFNSGSSIGSMITPPLVIWLAAAYGWKPAFLLTGSLEIILSVVWFWLYRDPEAHPNLSPAERAYIEGGRVPEPETKPSFRAVLARPKLYGIIVARFLTEPAWQTFAFWIPLYMSPCGAWTSSSSPCSPGCRSCSPTSAACSAAILPDPAQSP